MITLAGYQAETHKVITPDGYILTLYRLVKNWYWNRWRVILESADLYLCWYCPSGQWIIVKDCGEWTSCVHAARSRGQLIRLVSGLLSISPTSPSPTRRSSASTPTFSTSRQYLFCHDPAHQGAGRPWPWSSSLPSCCRGDLNIKSKSWKLFLSKFWHSFNFLAFENILHRDMTFGLAIIEATMTAGEFGYIDLSVLTLPIFWLK